MKSLAGTDMCGLTFGYVFKNIKITFGGLLLQIGLTAKKSHTRHD